MLASVVIKIEYRRTLHQDSVGLLRNRTIPSVSATKSFPILSLQSAFLPGTSQYVECAVTHSKQTTEAFLPGTRIAHQASDSLPNFGRKFVALGAKSLTQSRANGRP